VQITAYEVEPSDDEAFLAAFAGAGVLYRALRADVDFRFVAIGDAPAGAHSGEYEAVREDGRADVEGGVVLINPFEVPEGADDEFLAGWDRAREVLSRRQGYLGTRLHRATGPADFRFVNVARWSSPLMFARALERPEFRASAEAIPFPSHPGLYLPVTR
jgi:heme oxygenase (mycobilin-producing)